MLENYKITDLPNVQKAICISDLDKLPADSLLLIQMDDSANPDDLNDMTDLFGSLQQSMGLPFNVIIVSKEIDPKLVVAQYAKSSVLNLDEVPDADLPEFKSKEVFGGIDGSSNEFKS